MSSSSTLRAFTLISLVALSTSLLACGDAGEFDGDEEDVVTTEATEALTVADKDLYDRATRIEVGESRSGLHRKLGEAYGAIYFPVPYASQLHFSVTVTANAGTTTAFLIRESRGVYTLLDQKSGSQSITFDQTTPKRARIYVLFRREGHPMTRFAVSVLKK